MEWYILHNIARIMPPKDSSFIYFHVHVLKFQCRDGKKDHSHLFKRMFVKSFLAAALVNILKPH